MFGVMASLLGGTLADDRSKPPSKVIVIALEAMAATATATSIGLTASVRDLTTRKCGLADGNTSLATGA
jgi:hypothetical protein